MNLLRIKAIWAFLGFAWSMMGMLARTRDEAALRHSIARSRMLRGASSGNRMAMEGGMSIEEAWKGKS